MSLMNDYIEKFGELPPLVATKHYEDDFYQELYKKALERGNRMTGEDRDKALENEEYDIDFKSFEKGDDDMELNKIKKLLKTYGASDNEINNFISDLQEDKEEIEEDEDFNYLDSETMNKLKADDKGKDIIMNAPTMKREELKKLVKEYLSKE